MGVTCAAMIIRRVNVFVFRFRNFALLVLLALMAHPGALAAERSVKLRVAPVYPDIAKRMKVVGKVQLMVTVDAAGNVTDAKLVNGNNMLAGAAMDAVKKWKFEAGSASDTFEVSINFSL